MKKFNTIISTIAAVALSGCYTSQFTPDAAAKANAAFAAAERNPQPNHAATEQEESIIRLWADIPDYVARLRSEKDFRKAPRLISSVPPSYPLIPLLGNVKATVTVSFVINEQGAVEAARVLESSDARFDQSAVEAVLQWKFLPAELEDGPTKAFIAVPLQFDGKR